MDYKIKLLIAIVSLYALVTIIFLNTLSSSTIIYKKNLYPAFGENNNTESNNLAKLDNFDASTCKTYDVVYTEQELIKIFNYRNYKQCVPNSKDSISFKNQILSVNCEENTKPQYAVDTIEKEIYGSHKKTLPSWSNFLPDFKEKQFLFIKCFESSVYALVFNRFNIKVSNACNEIRMSLGGNDKQMNVLLMVFDSISKFSFNRNLPKTSDFLEKLAGNKDFGEVFKVYNFEKATSADARTRWNMAQILYGRTWEEAGKWFGTAKENNLEKKQLDYQKYAIWSHYSSLGYVTMFSHNTGLNFLSLLTGKTIKADHVFQNFWNHAWGVLKKNDIADGQKCIGDRNAHDFSFDYTYQFFENYNKNNKFAYIHSNAAHEDTGNVKTIDSDLLKFLKNFLNMIKSRGDNLALFLISDHGHKQKNAPEWDIRTLFDVITPTTYLIMTKDIVNKLNADEILKHNEKQLISRFDINLSLKHLAYAPYNISIESWYPKAKTDYNELKIISIFQEKAEFDRSCDDIGVSKEYCICSWFEPVENNNKKKVIEKEMINLFSKYLEEIGSFKKNCKVKDRIIIVKNESLLLKSLDRGLHTKYKIELKTSNNNNSTIDFNFCYHDSFKKNKRKIVSNKLKPHSVFNIEKVKVFLQLDIADLAPECIPDFCSC